jgi:hypothetical protein
VTSWFPVGLRPAVDQGVPTRLRPADRLEVLAATLTQARPGLGPLTQKPVTWQEKGRYGDETVRSLAGLVCDGDALQRLTQDQLGELAFLLECAVRGKVTGRSLDSWLTQLAEGDDRRGAAETLRARLVEKTNEVELLGRREAA